MYLTQTLKHKRTEQLDLLARASGSCYSKVVSLVRQTHKKKGFWLSKNTVHKYMRHRDYVLHSQSVQACADSYFDSLKSFFEVRKSDPEAKPPKRTPKHFKVRWKSGAIRVKDNTLILSNGKGNEPVILEGIDKKPKYVEMYFKRGTYYFALVYQADTPQKQTTGITVSVDMGEIHPIVSFDGKQTTIYNGRFLRSLQRYKNKITGVFQQEMERCKRRSRRWYRLKKAKRSTLDKLNAQLKDAEHKITTKFISDCIEVKADTIVIGDLKGIRENMKFSKKSNQKVHQWTFARITHMITYKAEKAGIHVKSVSEAYTSQTCPKCSNRKKPTTREYKCPCGFNYHRDGVGAINIYRKVSELKDSVVGVMASPLSVKFNWHLRHTGLNLVESPIR